MIETYHAAILTHEVHARGTRYIAHQIKAGQRVFIMLVTGWTGNAGEWIALPVEEDEVSWDYLAEKCPEIERHGGDREGFVKLFANMGVRVFNWNLGEEDED